MKIGSEVKIKGIDVTAKVVQIGTHGLLMLRSDDLHAFDRNVYSPWEVEEIEREKTMSKLYEISERYKNIQVLLDNPELPNGEIKKLLII